MPATPAERAAARERARRRAVEEAQLHSTIRTRRATTVSQIVVILFAVTGAAAVLIVASVLWLVYSLKTATDAAESRRPTSQEREELRTVGRIAFSKAERDTFTEAIYVMNGDGSGLRRVGPGTAPSWSPNRSRIVYELFAPRGGGWWGHFVAVMRADGTRGQRLVRGRAPDWSPDGSRILFTRERSIWIMRADGSGARRLRLGTNPRWSPDGRRIAFEHGGGVWSAAPDGSELRKLADGGEPAWSPDGETILLTVRQESESLFGEYPTELALVDADGGGIRRLGRGAIFPPSIEAGAWSPDGRWIVFSCAVDEICVTRSDWGGDWLNVGRVPLGSPLDPAWR